MYLSREIRAVLNKDKFLQISRKGHTWHGSISIPVSKRKEARLQVFIFPRVSDSNSNNSQIAKLDVTAEVKFLGKLNSNNEECRIRVETEIWDTHMGRSIGSTEFQYFPVTVDDGKVNFRQDLVSCDQIKECRSNKVTLTIKALLAISAQQQYDIREVDGFTVVEKVQDE